jgi:hypothetical protein
MSWWYSSEPKIDNKPEKPKEKKTNYPLSEVYNYSVIEDPKYPGFARIKVKVYSWYGDEQFVAAEWTHDINSAKEIVQNLNGYIAAAEALQKQLDFKKEVKDDSGVVADNPVSTDNGDLE